MKNRDKIYSRL